MAKKTSTRKGGVKKSTYLRTIGRAFISRAKIIMASGARETFTSLAKKASGDDFKYSVKNDKLIVTDIKEEKSLALALPARKSSQ